MNFFQRMNSFWEKVVNIGSHQLVLPAIYQGIMDKKIQKNIPIKLINYLENIHEINFNRNTENFKSN